MKMHRRWLIFQNSRIVLLKESQNFPEEEAIEGFLPHVLRQFSIGEGFYAVEIQPQAEIPDTCLLVSFKTFFRSAHESLHPIIARGFSVLNWDKNHQFCGKCSNKTEIHPELFERHCASCELVFYPRISPSIIVLIQKGEEVLMARSPHFPADLYSLIAGFVEPGETVEEAVHREVKEEVGLLVKNLRYFGSQSWPFPDSLMLGFFADYAAGEITPEPIEIESADWFSVDNLPEHPATASIAGKLIEAYVRALRPGKK